ncbi:DUF92 domain-containing protein [Natribacillus halophilus]|uniref:TIGR00297 family protein n=1 Tax=Natribacillus halophilus TaxID=549003 RepID=A0A1G8JNX7_9BACI|nr:DUF92 domain-containing protein [Natribacillus halophilus]SDI32781.1 TIGR00297 family protein [Natribacillus halophilus]
MLALLILTVAILAFLAYRFQALTLGGALMAFLVGAGIAIPFSFEGLLVLATFFISSTLLGRLPARTFKREKEKRTASQVFANGGVAALIALLSLPFADEELFKVLFIGALAAANSDTWATEGGKRWGGKPYHIRMNARATVGRSGSMTFVGTVFSVLGSGLVAILGSLLLLDGQWALLITIAGFLGAMADTLIGAFLQEERQCVRCQALIEEKRHCGQPTRKVRGISGLDNNMVNTACTGMGAFVAMMIFLLV